MTKPRIHHCISSLLLLVGIAFGGVASADELFVLVTERDIDGAQSSWWAEGATPQWTATDEALRAALQHTGVGFHAVGDLSSLSKIYRTASPTDANAMAMASIFGATRVLVGTVAYAPTTLQPLGLSGWTAEVSLRLIERGDRGPVLLKELAFHRARWSASPDEALAAVREEVATSVAGGAVVGLVRKVGPVGVPSEEPFVAVIGPSTRGAVEALRSKLGELAGVEGVIERWGSEGVVALEINPDKRDSRDAIAGYVNLVISEGTQGYRVVPASTTIQDVIAVQLEEVAP